MLKIENVCIKQKDFLNNQIITEFHVIYYIIAFIQRKKDIFFENHHLLVNPELVHCIFQPFELQLHT